jgi:mannose-6-phosphate isomerase
MELLDNPIRRYAWGSRTAIAELQGRPVPTAHPEAEVWLGAHPGDPSYLVDADGGRRSLIDELRGDPATLLGGENVKRWSGRLPFLLKVLAADEPLSLQSHPSAAQAVAGFAREQAAGIPLDDPGRSYKDDSHKPEMICALTEFHALAGFRAPDDTVRLLRALEVADLDAHVELLARQPDVDGLRALLSTWITLPQQTLDRLVPAVQEACVRLLQRHDVPESAEFQDEVRTALELAERYPGDAGVLASLLLNRVTLAPGQAIYQASGVLHAYLSGVGVELMANSDNVLRGGLTPKHVDVPELLRVLDFQPGPAPIAQTTSDGALTCYESMAEEFRLWRLDWSGEGGAGGTASAPGEAAGAGDIISLPTEGPRIVLCTEGRVTVSAGSGRSLTISRGESLWLNASDTGVQACSSQAPAQLFVATDGLRGVGS